MALLGLLLSFVGMDQFNAVSRFTFGILELQDGISIVPIVMGLFGISEILINMEQPLERKIYETKIKGLFPTLQDWMQSKWAILRVLSLVFFVDYFQGEEQFSVLSLLML